MDCAPNVNIFRELQTVHDTGYFSGHVSPEEDWQQVRKGGMNWSSVRVIGFLDWERITGRKFHINGWLRLGI